MPASIPAGRESTSSHTVRTCRFMLYDAKVHAEAHKTERHRIFIRRYAKIRPRVMGESRFFPEQSGDLLKNVVIPTPPVGMLPCASHLPGLVRGVSYGSLFLMPFSAQPFTARVSKTVGKIAWSKAHLRRQRPLIRQASKPWEKVG